MGPEWSAGERLMDLENVVTSWLRGLPGY